MVIWNLNTKGVSFRAGQMNDVLSDPGSLGVTWRLHSPTHFNTPLKFNMEPENQAMEKEIPFGNHHFQVPC